MTTAQRAVLCRIALGAAGLLATSLGAEAQHYKVSNYVSDLPGQGQRLDVNLVNPWGLARSENGPWFVANNGSATSTSYDINGVLRAPVVTIPGAQGSKGTPTGVVYNGTKDFEIAPGKPARYIFVSEDGTISGWNPDISPTAVVKSSIPTAVYKGIAIANFRGANYLYVVNFKTHRIDTFNSQFQLVRLRLVYFADGAIPANYSPFNIWNIGNALYVTYAQVDPATLDEVPGAGKGYVNVFTTGGVLQQRLQRGPWLNAPWGLALAPNDFGAFTHYLLVGQFGSGQVAAYELVTGAFAGLLRDPADNVLTIPGLWALSFGNSGMLGTLGTRLFFTAGAADETHGQFGIITPQPGEAPLGNGQ
jgi:uncharacterized protein (TIGR03118 family)